jgi:hypothetical protein
LILHDKAVPSLSVHQMQILCKKMLTYLIKNWL